MVDSAAYVSQAPEPPSRETELLDLTPLLDVPAPDLVIAICRSDLSATRWVWTTYASDPNGPATDAPNVATLDDVAAFALETRSAIQFSSDPFADCLTLAGRARRIGASVPRAVHDTVRSAVTAPGRTDAQRHRGTEAPRHRASCCSPRSSSSPGS